MLKSAMLLLSLSTLRALAQEPTLNELTERLRTQEQRIVELERRQEAEDNTSGATTLGGYGELHYNNLDANAAANDVDQIDLHRFVLFVGHQFSDKVRLFSEIEVEHSLAGDGKPGEVEIEQAYVDIRLNNSLSAKAGLFLLPIGFLNEIHEPPTFYGVERNDIESIIVPTTWWEAGGGFSGRTEAGIGWDVAMHSGLAMPTSGGSAFRVRSGRQKVAEALASDWAYTARVSYAGWPGFEVAVSYQYQSDPSQIAGDGLDTGQLMTANLIYRNNDFSLKALYGAWHLDGFAVEAAGADKQDGWFIEPSYRLNQNWGVYARLEDVDGARAVDKFQQWEAGFNYWLNPKVVFKFDYRQRDLDLPLLAGANFDGFDLGLGFQF